MRKFNWLLCLMDMVILALPFWFVSVGYYGFSQFFFGFACMWIFLNFKKGKVNLKRYTYNEEL